jgi:hypothetical protein
MLFVFLSGGKQNAITWIWKHLGARTDTHRWLSASASLPTTPLLYTIPSIQLLTTPTHTSPLLSSANTSPPLHPTAHNHGYYAVADYSSAAILSPGLCARSPENDEKGKKIVGPYIPYGLFQTKGQMYAKFGSDWFRNVNLYKVQTHTHTNKLIFSFIYKILWLKLHSFSS